MYADEVLTRHKGLLTCVARKITAYAVLEQLADLFIIRGTPTYVRSDNGPEFAAKIVRGWLGKARCSDAVH